MYSLRSYINEQALDIIEKWEKEFDVKIIISNTSSKTRLGVFIPKKKGPHIIRINNDLNKYMFLITLIHEFAHASVWKMYGRHVRPHGDEWKKEFKHMILPFLNPTFFTNSILRHLSLHILHPSASIVRDTSLFNVLREYDDNLKITIDQIQDGDRFRTIDGKEFERICKLRKYYKCKRLETGRFYRVPPFTEIILL